MSREAEVVTYLRADSGSETIAPGGIYAYSDLGEEGITDSATTPDVYAGGELQTTIVVRERSPVPTGDLQSIASQRTSMSQVIEVWAYSSDTTAIEAALNWVYGLMMGKRLARTFSATWAGGMPIQRAPELSGIFTRHEDYRVVSIRTPAAV